MKGWKALKALTFEAFDMKSEAFGTKIGDLGTVLLLALALLSPLPSASAGQTQALTKELLALALRSCPQRVRGERKRQ